MATATVTTGPVLNSSETGVRASTVRVMVVNEDTIPATLEIQVFSIQDSPNNSAKIGIAHRLVAIAANGSLIVDIPIFQVPIYEVQLQGISSNPTIVDIIPNVVAVDAAGRLVDNQQFLITELATIPALTPIP